MGARTNWADSLVTARVTAWRAALCAAMAAAAACGPAGAAPPGAPPPAAAAVDVRLARAESGVAPRRLRSMGTLFAEEEVTVAAEVSGRLVAVLADVGDRVAPGHALVRIDDRDLVLDRDQRRRALDETLAKLGLSELPDAEPDLDELPSVERARLAAQNAKARHDRAKTLRDRTPPLISEQDLEDMRTAWAVAESDREGAALAARALLAEARTRRAQLDVAEDRLRKTVIAVPSGTRPAVPGSGGAPSDAPHTFVVAERRVAAGDFVSVGDPLFRLLDCDPLQLRLSVPERRMEGVVAGLRVLATVAGNAKPIEGRVGRVRPEVDPRTRTYQVDVLVPNGDLHLVPGAFATAEIETGEDRGVVFVPETAVRTFAGVRKVVVVEAGKAVERPVVLGRRAGARVEIVSGLAAGDSYVSEPPADLIPGNPVRVTGGDPGGSGGDGK